MIQGSNYHWRDAILLQSGQFTIYNLHRIPCRNYLIWQSDRALQPRQKAERDTRNWCPQLCQRPFLAAPHRATTEPRGANLGIHPSPLLPRQQNVTNVAGTEHCRSSALNLKKTPYHEGRTAAYPSKLIWTTPIYQSGMSMCGVQRGLSRSRPGIWSSRALCHAIGSGPLYQRARPDRHAVYHHPSYPPRNRGGAQTTWQTLFGTIGIILPTHTDSRGSRTCSDSRSMLPDQELLDHSEGSRSDISEEEGHWDLTSPRMKASYQNRQQPQASFNQAYLNHFCLRPRPWPTVGPPLRHHRSINGPH